jgi:hypothetical protein
VTELALANDLVTYAFQGKTVYRALVDYTVLLIFTGACLAGYFANTLYTRHKRAQAADAHSQKNQRLPHTP